ncbi:DUF7093 family protein [Halorubrum yunnanense]|uniref:Oxidoreductase n=1 Tax=Halorubrum yunnanense TaxID=1526162 RepID=A0ABD5YGD7_9EURY|nr:hypothetical protein [Halorubrum yunnanense]
MGLRCLLGHDFDEPELRREREEDGDEVVTTVTEVKTCARCGETQVVSENTEVTTMAQLADEAAAGAEASGGGPAETGPAVGGGDRGASSDAGSDAGPTSAAATDAEAGAAESATGASADAGADDAVIIDDGPDGVDDEGTEGEVASDGPAGAAGGDGAAADGVGAADDGTEGGEDEGAELLNSGADDGGDSLGGSEEYAEYPDVESAESPGADGQDAETDDGVILDDEGEQDEGAADRERGAWPEVDEEDDSGATTPWPEQRAEDEGFSAEVGEGGAGDVDFGGGLTPEAAESSAGGEDTEYVEAPERDADEVDGTVEPQEGEAEPADAETGITRAESPDLSTSTSETATEYHCPECGMSRDADGNSMRAGDICPECKRGYVTERPI